MQNTSSNANANANLKTRTGSALGLLLEHGPGQPQEQAPEPLEDEIAPPDPDATGPKGRKRPSDTVTLALAGGGLLTMAAAFLWRDLSLSPAHLVTVGAAAGLGASMALGQRRTSGVGILTLFAATLIGGIWFALSRDPYLLLGLGVSFVGAVLNAIFAYPRARRAMDRMRSGQIFALLTLTTLGATTAGYFHFFTMGVESLGRRLVLTLIWSLLGVVLLVCGGRAREAAMRYSGYAFLFAALTKVLVYDTTHLTGTLRIGALALSGAMLIVGSLLNRGNEQPR